MSKLETALMHTQQNDEEIVATNEFVKVRIQSTPEEMCILYQTKNITIKRIGIVSPISSLELVLLFFD